MRRPVVLRKVSTNVVLPAPLGTGDDDQHAVVRSKALSQRVNGFGAIAHRRSSGRTASWLTSSDESALLEPTHRPPAIRLDAHDRRGPAGIALIDHFAPCQRPREFGTIRGGGDLLEEGVDGLPRRETREGACQIAVSTLEREHILVAESRFDGPPELGPVLDLCGDGAVGGFRLRASQFHEFI
jgi:hypothetical protein